MNNDNFDREFNEMQKNIQRMGGNKNSDPLGMSKLNLNKKETSFDKETEALVKTAGTIIQCGFVLWIAGALLTFSFVGAVIYLIIKVALHL